MSQFNRFDIAVEPEDFVQEASTNTAEQLKYLDTLINTIHEVLKRDFNADDNTVARMEVASEEKRNNEASRALIEKYKQSKVSWAEATKALGSKPVYYSIKPSTNVKNGFELTRLSGDQKGMFVMYSNPTPELITIVPAPGQSNLSLNEVYKYFEVDKGSDGKGGILAAVEPTPFLKNDQGVYTMINKGVIYLTSQPQAQTSRTQPPTKPQS